MGAHGKQQIKKNHHNGLTQSFCGNKHKKIQSNCEPPPILNSVENRNRAERLL